MNDTNMANDNVQKECYHTDIEQPHPEQCTHKWKLGYSKCLLCGIEHSDTMEQKPTDEEIRFISEDIKDIAQLLLNETQTPNSSETYTPLYVLNEMGMRVLKLIGETYPIEFIADLSSRDYEHIRFHYKIWKGHKK